MRTLLVVTAALVIGCRGGGGAVDAGALDCPDEPPAAGAACDVGALCAYERCAGEGLVHARCVATDAGAGAWSVDTAPCPECSGSACAPGSICVARVGGALISSCASHTCGSGPLGCECVCGAGARCEIGAYGAVVACHVDCGADVCP